MAFLGALLATFLPALLALLLRGLFPGLGFFLRLGFWFLFRLWLWFRLGLAGGFRRALVACWRRSYRSPAWHTATMLFSTGSSFGANGFFLFFVIIFFCGSTAITANVAVL